MLFEIWETWLSKIALFEMQGFEFLENRVQLPLSYEALAQETLANNSKSLLAKEDD